MNINETKKKVLTKEERKTLKIKQKEEKGKTLSTKEVEQLRLTRAKFHYKTTGEYTLRLKNVKKLFGNKRILDGVTFDLKKGEKLALIGKNGSGKSTLINVISQQLKMSEGHISYGYAKNRLESLELMGIQFQTLNYPEGFVVKDVIHFFNVSVEKTIRMSKKELSDIVGMFGIDKYLNQKIDKLSGGQQQRINILLALIKKPKFLILDEISTGLDVESSEIIKEYIEQYLKKYPETALLLISHSDEEIRELTNRVIVLESGKIVEDMSSNKLTSSKFLEITSREPKLSLEQKNIYDKESKKNVDKLSKYYNISPKGTLGKISNIITQDFSLKFNKINNSNISEENIIEIKGISKTYGKTVGAVRNLSMNIKDGERVAITGPNGSGKSTIVEIIAQIKTYDSKYLKFINMNFLAKSDYKNSIDKLNEEMNTKLRKFKNKYRLEKELSENEIKELIITKQKLIKISKQNAAKLSKKEKTYEIKLDIARAGEETKLIIEKEIEKINNDSEEKVEKDRKEYINLENKLKKEIVNERKNILKEFNEKLIRIAKEKKIYKDKKLVYIGAYKLNGKNISRKEIKRPKNEIIYSFSTISRKVKDETGVQFQYASFPVEMSVLDVILFFSRTNEKYLNKEQMINAVKIFRLETLLDSKAYKLSGGERQRLNVLLSIMKSPKILILDEISTGLDVDSIVRIDKFIQDYLNRSGATLILISHNYHEVHSLTNRIIVMKNGSLSEIVDTEDWSLSDTKNKMRDIYKGSGI